MDMIIVTKQPKPKISALVFEGLTEEDYEILGLAMDTISAQSRRSADAGDRARDGGLTLLDILHQSGEIDGAQAERLTTALNKACDALSIA